MRVRMQIDDYAPPLLRPACSCVCLHTLPLQELPHSFYETFRNEVMEAILAPANGSASSPLPSQRGLASTPPASAGSSS